MMFKKSFIVTCFVYENNINVVNKKYEARDDDKLC